MDESEVKSDFLRVTMERGLFHQASNIAALDELLLKGPVSGYIGFDATARSFHIGNLVQIMRLYWLQQTGHRPIVLMGGGTTRIGDPSGKDETRKILDDQVIQENIESLKGTFSKFLSFGDSPNGALFVNNDEWLSELRYIEVLRQVGRHFSINRMLSMDSVQSRLSRQQELTFLEFNYMILQAYDFVQLRRRYDCRLEMGGSDQWGNIIMGLELGRRMELPDLFALTCPLITTADGAKMGKTAKGAVWLSPSLLSPYDYWQYWRNVADADVGRFLRIFTTLPMPEIARLESLRGRELNEAKKILATEATRILHGSEEAERAALTAAGTFEEGQTVLTLPTRYVGASQVQGGMSIIAAFVEAGLVSSKSDGRRQISAGALHLNDTLVKDDAAMLRSEDFREDGVAKLSFGKKKHVLLRLQQDEAGVAGG